MNTDDPSEPCPRVRPDDYDGPVARAPYLDNPPERRFRWYDLDRAALRRAGRVKYPLTEKGANYV